MTSRERVHAALERKPVDRVPVFMWFHPETSVRLAKLLEIPVGRVGEAMGNDACQTWVNNNYAMEGIVHERDGESHTDYWGIRWVKDGAFNQIEGFPLAGDADSEAVLGYQFPHRHKEDLLRNMEPVVKNAGDRFIGCDISPCGFEMYWRLRGMENALMDFAGEPDLAAKMIERCADFAISLGESACERFPLDWLWTGDDVASQTDMMMSPQTWREIVRSHLQRVFNVGKRRNLWVAYHCCGALRSIIGDLVEMGPRCPESGPVQLSRHGRSGVKAGIRRQTCLHGGRRHPGHAAERKC